MTVSDARSILLVIYSLRGGGAERTTANMANYWAGQGRKVTILVLSDTAPDDYSTDPAVNLVPLRSVGSGITGNTARLRAVRREILRHSPDVVIGIMMTSNVLIALAGTGLGIPLVGTVHTHPSADMHRIWKVAARYLYRRLDMVVALTEGTRAWLKANTRVRHTTVIPNAVMPPADPDLDPQPDAREKLLIAVGRLVDSKNFTELVEIFGKLAPMHDNWRLVILGDGPDRPLIEKRIADLGLNDRVSLPGFVRNIQEWYDRASIMVSTSLHEGFPMTLLEGMASALPAVSYDCPEGPRDIIRDGIDGYLVELGHAADFTERLDSLMADGATRAMMARRATDVRIRFGMETVMQQWDALFSRLLAGKAASRGGGQKP